MRSRLSRTSSTLALGAVLALSACGGGSSGGSNANLPSDPQGELSAAVSNLSNATTVTATLKLDATANTLQQIGQATNSPISADAANAIASAEIVITGDKGKKASDFAVDVNGNTLVDFRTVDGTLYLKADVKNILALAHQESQLQALQSQAAALPQFVQAILRGDWVSLDKATLTSLQNQIAPNTGTQTPNSAEVLNQVKAIFAKDVTATRAGTDSLGDHLKLTANTRAIVTDFQSLVTSTVPGGSALGSQLGSPNSIPSRNITIDAWVSNGALSKVSLDLAQFDTKHQFPQGTSLPLSMSFTQTATDISAPSGATPVDLSQLTGLLGAVTGGSAGGSSGF